MLGRVRTVAVIGLEAVPVDVEAWVGSGLPGFGLIGGSGTAAAQAADRVRTALAAVGVAVGSSKVLVSMAPADVPKAGARYDVAIAVAVLAALGVVAERALEGTALLGELALDGAVRPVPGVLPSAAGLRRLGCRRLLVADGNAAEAALVDGLAVVPVADLREVAGVLTGEQAARPVPAAAPPPAPPLPDLADVRGQQAARRALEVAAAGGHHLLLLGPPGCGKSMLARRLPGLLPPLDDESALELAAVRSVAGRGGGGGGHGGGLDRRPPFRAPHHSVSVAALVGGGSGVARPGELSLATSGVLFLDELFEWSRATLDTLRQPLEEGVVRVARSQATVTYPARVLLVAAANPCPCGGGERCTCGDEAIWAYRGRLSGPLADRLDLAPAVSPLRAGDLVGQEPGEPTAAVAGRVAAARAMAAARGGAGLPNAAAPVAAVRRTTRAAALRALASAVDAGALTARGFDRALRVARTCADLEGAAVVERDHVLEALAHRAQLQPPATAPVGR